MEKYKHYYDSNIVSIGINNFRVFSTETNFSISPITILTGTNSSGKSSLIKALKLLIKSYEKNGLRKLELMDTNLKLGEFSSIKNSSNKNDIIEFNLEIEAIPHMFYRELSTVSFTVKLFYKPTGLIKFSVYDSIGLLFEEEGDFGNTYKKPTKSFIRLDESILNKSTISNHFDSLNNTDLEIVYQSLLDFLQNNLDLHDIKSELYEYSVTKIFDLIGERLDRIILGLSYTGFVESSTGYYVDDEGESVEYIREEVYSNRSSFLDILPKHIIDKVEDSKINEFFTVKYLNEIPKSIDLIVANIFPQIFSKFEFIEGVRATQEIVYTKANNPEFYELLDNIHNSNDSNFMDSLEYWLVNKLEILNLKGVKRLSDIFQIQQIPGYGYILAIYENGTYIGLSGLGYGIAQLLPILFKLIINNGAGKTYVIEEPESNLHPALQSQLSDIFQSFVNGKMCAQFNDGKFVEIGSSSTNSSRLIIETHSEYLVRKLQFLTAKGLLEPNKSIIYYFNPTYNIPKGERKIKEININVDGSLTDDFGTGFFDEADNIALELFLIKQSQNN